MNQSPTISSAELQKLLAAGSVSLIDVRLAADHAAEHLPGAVSNCVFEVDFLPRMEQAFADRTTPICVYGASASSHESRMAAEKLRRAGYEQIAELAGGLEGWKVAGFETTTGEAIDDTPPSPEGTFPIDLAESPVEWLGRNLINKHWGTIPLKSGELHFSDGRLSGGEFVLNMPAMECTDLAGHELHDVLIGHLKSDDFFDTDRYPEARLVIESSEPIENREAGEQNLRVQGSLTLCGETRPLSFEAAAGFTDEGKPAAQTAFAIDRTEWNVIYGSGKFFKRLAGHLVNDLIELQIRILTN